VQTPTWGWIGGCLLSSHHAGNAGGTHHHCEHK
jgi:hypothetical protein